jgi:hypothetical protein
MADGPPLPQGGLARPSPGRRQAAPAIRRDGPAAVSGADGGRRPNDTPRSAGAPEARVISGEESAGREVGAASRAAGAARDAGTGFARVRRRRGPGQRGPAREAAGQFLRSATAIGGRCVTSGDLLRQLARNAMLRGPRRGCSLPGTGGGDLPWPGNRDDRGPFARPTTQASRRPATLPAPWLRSAPPRREGPGGTPPASGAACSRGKGAARRPRPQPEMKTGACRRAGHRWMQAFREL